MINKDKTEQYLINRATHEWTKCKHLGSMHDTKDDIKRSKVLTINAANRVQAISDTKKFTPEIKMTAFRAYIKPIFLYNREIWIITFLEALF